MQYRQLGRSGVRVSTIGLGTNRFGTKLPADEVPSAVDAALDLGINHIDTANIYTNGLSEELLGKALKGRWDRVVLASKFTMKSGDGPNDTGSSRYHLMNALDASLRRLQSDHIDLYYIHQWDAETPMDETLRALDDVVRTGKVRYVGISNWSAWALARADLMTEFRGWSRPIVIQSEYSMVHRAVEQEILPYCHVSGIGFIPYFPLAGGFLTGKYRRGQPPPPGSRGETATYVQALFVDPWYDRLEQLTQWSEARGHKLNEMAIAWLLARPEIPSVIAGLTRIEQLQANTRAAEWTLTPDEVSEINRILG